MPFERSFAALVLGLVLALATTGCGSERAGNAASSDAGAQSGKVQILSAAVGTDTGTSCPNATTGLDNMPVTFNCSFSVRRSM